jgi:hypothetical protein
VCQPCTRTAFNPCIFFLFFAFLTRIFSRKKKMVSGPLGVKIIN